MFAGAAFTDQADISQTEAVDMLTALGVIEGFPDGSFAPDATITRAQAAKMIYTIWNGGNADASAFEGKSVFTDVYSGHWAEGYINFCYINGIINGLSATKFGPDDSVTGTQLAKMLLICMGYQADKSGLEGTGYSQRTNALATQNGLYVDVTAPVNSAMPRQFASQLMYNALKADTVVWSTDNNAYSKVTTIGYKMVKNDNGDYDLVQTTVNETMGKKCMDLNTTDVVLTEVEKEANRDTYTLNDGDFTRVANDYSNLIGQRVNVMYKGNDTSKVYGVYAHEDSEILAEGYVGQLENVVSDTKKIKLDGTEYKLDGTTDDKVYTVNDDVAARTKLVDLAATAKTNGTAKQNDVARSIKLIDNDGNGKADYVLSNPVQFGQVTYLSDSAMTVSGVGSFDLADLSGHEDIEKDDYVFVTKEEHNSSDKTIITKADVTSTEIEATRSDASDKVIEARIDDVWYRTANNVNIKSGSSYDLVLCGNYILAADETAGSIEEVALLAGVNNDGTNVTVDTAVGSKNKEGTVKARLYFIDGTNAEVKLSKFAGDKLVKDVADTSKGDGTINADTVLAGYINKSGLVTFSKLSDDTYDVKAVADKTNMAGCDAYKKVAAVKDGKIDNMLINDDAVFFVEANDEIKVVSGSAVKNWKDTTLKIGVDSYVLTDVKNGLDYVAAGYLRVTTPKVPGATSDTKYGYLTRDAYTVDTDDGQKATYEVWTSEGTKTLTEDGTTGKDFKSGTIIAYTINGDFIDDVKTVGEKVAILGTNNEVEGVATLTTGNGISKTYSFDADCVFVGIDHSDTKGVEGDVGAINIAQPIDTDNDGDAEKYYANAFVVYDDAAEADKKIVAIFFDADKLGDGAADKLFAPA